MEEMNLNTNGNGDANTVVAEKWINHYSSKHKILLVGEGDFSFATCLAEAFGSAANITATSLEYSKDLLTMKYSKARSNLMKLEVSGCTIIHGVDANTMSHHPQLFLQEFDRIVYNFPHSGFHFRESNTHQIQLHKNLVEGFLRNARSLVKENGEIHITHKTGGPFSKWEIEELATKEGLYLVEKVPFCIWDYPGYVNKRGDGHRCDESFPVGQCSTFKFAKTSILRQLLNLLSL